MLENLTNVIVRQFCGMPTAEIDGVLYSCVNEAQGELTAVMEDGTVVPVPVCDQCLEKARERFDITDTTIV